MNDRKQYLEMMKKYRDSRGVRKNDIIKCKGLRVIVDEVISSEFYINQNYDGFDYIVEFRDLNGNYRSWKSYIDGGEVEFRGEPIYAEF